MKGKGEKYENDDLEYHKVEYKRREYKLQVLNVQFWKIEEYRDGKFIGQFGCFKTRKQAEQVLGEINYVIEAFIQDNKL
jgi:hypothetical protein